MSKCEFCEETLNGLPIICSKCGKHFCSKHKFPEDHKCVNKDKPAEKDKGIIEHEKREKEHANYVNEEINIIKRRLHKNHMFKGFFGFLWVHKFSVIFLILLFTAYYLQSNEIYDVKGEAENLLIKLKVGEGVLKTEEPIIDNLTKYEKVGEVTKTIDEDPGSLIAKIQDVTAKYYSSEVTVTGFVEWKEVKGNTLTFQHVIVDDTGRYLPFIFKIQQIGFNKYSKYDIHGIVKKDGDITYIEAKIIEKSLN